MPELIPVWASSGNIVTPDASKVAQGWLLGEKPPHEYMNWFMNIVADRLNHVIRNGVAGWDSTIQYPTGAFTRRGGFLYRAISSNINQEPSASPTSWTQITENASSLSSGTLPNARLTGSYTNFVNITASGNVTANKFVGLGGELENLNADKITSGTVANARLSGNYTGITHLTASGNVTAGKFIGPGSGITGINANELTAGTLANARLSGAYSFASLELSGKMKSGTAEVTGLLEVGGSVVATGNVSANNFVGSGQGLTGLNGSMVATGTVSAARLPPADDGVERSRIMAHVGNTLIGASGTTIMARYNGSDNVEPGTNVNGNRLQPANANGDVSASVTALSGTWKCKGVVVAGGSNAQRTTEWMRVSE